MLTLLGLGNAELIACVLNKHIILSILKSVLNISNETETDGQKKKERRREMEREC